MRSTYEDYNRQRDLGRDLVSSASRALLVCASVWAVMACRSVDGIDPADPARGPGQMVGNGDRVSDGNFVGGNDAIPAPADVDPPSTDEGINCDLACRSHCDSLGLQNPVNIGVCPHLWGVGLESQPIDHSEACRRLYVDLVGRFPTPEEVNSVCNRDSWGATVKELLATEEFRFVHQRRWADKLLYNTRAINVERIYDMDSLVGKTYDGRVSWDQFVEVTSAHPVLVRRLDSAADRAAAVFQLFLGRPPYENERSDVARLYALWQNGYWEQPYLGVVPEPYIEYRCVTESGSKDPETVGACTSVLWGRRELVLAPDYRREKEGEQEGWMWSGKLSADEWNRLQEPGRVVASLGEFWEWTVDEVLEQYLGYDFGRMAPEARQELVGYVLRYNGDVRALHYAVATSIPYLQSSRGSTPTDFRWTYGPLKQTQAEPWIDSVLASLGREMGNCDHRISNPEDFLEEEMSGWAYALVDNSRWDVREDKRVWGRYRDLAQTLGGCPTNEIGGRFTAVSILNTAVQEAFVAEVCDPALQGGDGATSIDRLLPSGVGAGRALDEQTAVEVIQYQTRLFFGREASEEEIESARSAASQCTPTPCDAGTFARPACFALLTSAEMLFY